jgi:uncharacterized protein (UPF0147 family)
MSCSTRFGLAFLLRRDVNARSQAKENVRRALESKDPHVRQESLEDSLRSADVYFIPLAVS